MGISFSRRGYKTGIDIGEKTRFNRTFGHEVNEICKLF